MIKKKLNFTLLALWRSQQSGEFGEREGGRGVVELVQKEECREEGCGHAHH